MVCRPHSFLGRNLNGLSLCLLVHTTRKRVHEFFDTDLSAIWSNVNWFFIYSCILAFSLICWSRDKEKKRCCATLFQKNNSASLNLKFKKAELLHYQFNSHFRCHHSGHYRPDLVAFILLSARRINRCSHQFLHWWQQHATGILHFRSSNLSFP